MEYNKIIMEELTKEAQTELDKVLRMAKAINNNDKATIFANKLMQTTKMNFTELTKFVYETLELKQ